VEAKEAFELVTDPIPSDSVLLDPHKLRDQRQLDVMDCYDGPPM
jgi:hypothetical protein